MRRLLTRVPRWLQIAVVLVVVLGAAAATLLVILWPFTRAKVTQALARQSSGRVEIRRFRSTFFPRPGCVAEGVVIHRAGNPSGPPLIAIPRMAVTGDYVRLLMFSKDLRAIRTEGMHIRIPGRNEPGGKRSGGSERGRFQIDELVADHTVLEFAPDEPGHAPYIIGIHHARLSPVSPREALHFETLLHIPEPDGEVRASGHFGPWRSGDPYGTVVSGSYRLEHANLEFTRGVSGLVNSRGSFHGSVRRIDVQGSAEVPDFEVSKVRNRAGLAARFHTVVNGQTGEVRLESVDARLNRTRIAAGGIVKSGRQPPASLALAVPEGRIEDLLYLVSSGRPKMTGTVTLRTQAAVNSGKARFLERLQMSLDFRVSGARFTAPKTEQGMDNLSGRAQGEKGPDPDTHSDFGGHVTVSGGTARLSDVSFRVPGITARLGGTYGLLDERVDLRGTAQLDEPLSHMSSGVKSLLAKVLNPFFRRRHRRGSTVPFKITGAHGSASLGIDFGRKS